MGNTPKVAEKHYLQTTEDHFQMAAQGVAESVAVHPKKCAESVAVHQGTQEQERTKAPVETEAFRSEVVFCESSENSPAPPVGLEQPYGLPGETAFEELGVAETVAVDQQLAVMHRFWQRLSPQQKDELMRLAQRLASTSTEQGESS